jgi:hypothetical protein
LPLSFLGDRQAFQLGQVFPEHVEGRAPDHPAIIVDRHEKFADRLVQLTWRPSDHQLAIGEGSDQFLDRRDVTDASGANVQSRDPQTPALTPGDLASAFWVRGLSAGPKAKLEETL